MIKTEYRRTSQVMSAVSVKRDLWIMLTYIFIFLKAFFNFSIIQISKWFLVFLQRKHLLYLTFIRLRLGYRIPICHLLYLSSL